MKQLFHRTFYAALAMMLALWSQNIAQGDDILPVGTYVYAVSGTSGTEKPGCYRVTGYDTVNRTYYGEYVGPTCPSTVKTSVRGTAFIDSNMNGKRDVGEPTLGHAYYKLTDGGSWFVCGYVAHDGTFGIPVTAQDFVLMPIAPPGYKTTTPYIRVTAGATASIGNDMGFVPDPSAKLETCDQYNPPRAGFYNVADTLRAYNIFGQFMSAAQKANVLSAWGSGDYTIFAPTDEAFAKIPPATLNAWLRDPAKLAVIINNHVVKGRYDADMISKFGTLKALSGRDLVIKSQTYTTQIGSANVIRSNITATNGVVHVIDTVIQ